MGKKINKKCRKHKKHTPRPVDSSAFNSVIVDAQLLDETQVLDIALHANLALEAMRKGLSTEDNWVTVACAMNMACVFCEMGIGADYRADLAVALEVCWRAKLNAARTGLWGFDETGMQAVAFALKLHDEQIAFAKCGEVKAAIEEIHRRVRADDIYKNVEHLEALEAIEEAA